MSRTGQVRLSVILRTLIIALVLLATSTLAVSNAAPAFAVGTYDNASIADKALTYWNGSNTNRAAGSAACSDAQKPGDSGGQCRAFVNCIVWMVSGGTQNLGGSDYFTPFTNAGGVEITNVDELAKGDIVQSGQGTHTYIIVSKVSSGKYMVVDSNHWNDETVGYYQRDVALDSTNRAFRMGTVGGTSGSTSDRISLLDAGHAIWSKTTTSNGGWGQQSGLDTAKSISVGGNNQLLIDLCDAVWAKDTAGNGGWTQETNCGSAKNAYVSNTGLQVILDFCGAIYAKKGIGNGGWGQQAGCSAGKAVAVSNTGLFVIHNYCNALWAKYNLGNGGWSQETSCDSVQKFDIGGDVQALVDLCGAIYARNGNGNVWTKEADCNAAKAIEVGMNGRQAILSPDDTIWSKDTIAFGGWGQQSGASAATAISVG